MLALSCLGKMITVTKKAVSFIISICCFSLNITEPLVVKYLISMALKFYSFLFSNKFKHPCTFFTLNTLKFQKYKRIYCAEETKQFRYLGRKQTRCFQILCYLLKKLRKYTVEYLARIPQKFEQPCVDLTMFTSYQRYEQKSKLLTVYTGIIDARDSSDMKVSFVRRECHLSALTKPEVSVRSLSSLIRLYRRASRSMLPALWRSRALECCCQK